MDQILIHSNLYDYEVNFVDGFTEKLLKFTDTTAYVIDEKVYSLYEENFRNLNRKNIFFIKAIENEKNMETVMNLIAFFQDIGVRKNWKVVCFGGGISQDITTMASNLFLRNVDWYFFPTTLLSMCDSCIGGKCGINYRHVKNQLGVFFPPKKIFIDIHFLDTLTHGDYVNGWGELLKFSLTNGTPFYEEIRKEKKLIPCPNIAHYIHKGLSVKKAVIEADEFESDLRRVLNYGHSFGHALEGYTENRIPHGMAVIWGIDIANFLAVREGLIDKVYAMDIKKFIKETFLTEEIIVKDPEKFFTYLKLDKKVKGNILSFALLDKPSHLVVHPITIDNKLLEEFREYLRDTHAFYNA